MTEEKLPPTEQRNPASSHFGELSAREVVTLMNREERRVLTALESAEAELAAIAEQIAARMSVGGRVFLLGAGTSGRLAAQEVAELPPTFGVDPALFRAITPGDQPVQAERTAPNEDDTEAAPLALALAGVNADDIAIGVSASGTAPFVLTGVAAAATLGAWTCGIANNPGTPLLDLPDLGVLLDTGPEVLTGSTRLKAGTAQKLALNRITTAAMVLSGRVMSNHMVELVGSNRKLRARAARILIDLSGCTFEEACRSLEASGWSVRTALGRSAD